MKAIIFSIGDELILGQTVDSNAAWLSRQLTRLGITITEHITMGDDVDTIAARLKQDALESDLILTTGGLGPTTDDLTRHALAQVLNEELVLNDEALHNIKSRYARMNKEMPPINKIQAMIPQGCDMIPNPVGTAPGISVQIGKARAYFMPGVPSEMKLMFTERIRNDLEKVLAGQKNIEIVFERTLHLVGTGESNVGQILGEMMQRGANPLVNSTAKQGILSLRILARAPGEAEAQTLILPIEQEIRRRLGDKVYGCDEETLPLVVGRELRRKGQTLAVAESCSGGMLAKEITDIPGASDYFLCGWVTYTNKAKSELLQVNSNLIQKHGAVSEEVAHAMAYNALRLAGADYALSTTGIAGPTGGTPEKPVGLVYIGLADKNNVQVKRYIFPVERENVRQRTINTALNLLRLKIQNI
ncbi:MAG: competence/damage-inducible protein A [Sedimentisphaerales bacterium]|nr:competence/damage-inducible protein A [Sedimentisphaerales bacterium]